MGEMVLALNKILPRMEHIADMLESRSCELRPTADECTMGGSGCEWVPRAPEGKRCRPPTSRLVQRMAGAIGDVREVEALMRRCDDADHQMGVYAELERRWDRRFKAMNELFLEFLGRARPFNSCSRSTKKSAARTATRPCVSGRTVPAGARTARGGPGGAAGLLPARGGREPPRS